MGELDLTPTAEELLAELAAAAGNRLGRREDEVTVKMVYERAKADGVKASDETIRAMIKAKVEAGELIERKVGMHAYYRKP